MPSLETLGYAFIGGLLPALVWLYFLLKEEERCPQPRSVVFATFVAGMLAVPLVIPFEELAVHSLPMTIPVIIAWATIEETVKYIAAALIILTFQTATRNAVDLVITMITIALGFAAVENGLFLLDPLSQGHFITGLVTNNLRFVGATLLHVVASSAIGFALAFSYNAPRRVRMFAASFGLILAIGLHGLFNYCIIQEDGTKTILAFFTVWTGAIVLFATFEILKYLEYRHLSKNTC